MLGGFKNNLYLCNRNQNNIRLWIRNTIAECIKATRSFK